MNATQVCFVSVLGRYPTKRCLPLRITKGIEEMRRGMMFKDSMNYALAFIYPDVAPRSMWMKNVRIPLDMVFCRGGKIVQIQSDVPGCIPITEEEENYSDSVCPLVESVPSDLVLELPGGWAVQLGLRLGDSVVFTNA